MKILFNRYFYVVSAVLFVLLLLGYFGHTLIFELWWFDTLNLAQYYIVRESLRDQIITYSTLFFTALVYLNLSAIPRVMGKALLNLLDSDNQAFLVHRKLLLLLSLLLSLPIIIPIAEHWKDVLLYFYAVDSGLKDPAYGRDISYYLFTFPVYTFLQKGLLAVFSLLFIASAIFYLRLYQKNQQQLLEFPKPAKIHLTLLVLLIVFIEAWSISFQGTELLYVNSNEPTFFGPGALEMKYFLPLIWLTFLIFLGLAGSIIYFIYTHQGKKYVFGFLAGFIFLLGFKHITFIPDLIKKIYIQPNPVRSEKKYIQYHIDATLDAFKLTTIENIQYPLLSALTPAISTDISQRLYNIPLWDHQLLQKVFEQLQTIRPYYSFTPVTVDRYQLADREYQVNIAARELTLGKLPAAARNWENSHLRYTHGYGVVATPASQKANQPMQWFLSEISLHTKQDKFRLEKPEIYYGLAHYNYAIVPNKAPKASSEAMDMNSDYQGTGGMGISSLFTKLVFSAYMGDEKIFFSKSITDASKLLVRRNIIKRIKTITPFLQLDSDPYPVVVNHHIYWIVDAYTTSNRYPLVRPINSPFAKNGTKTLNYIRNSVKIIVDAYNGSVDFYITDSHDPIAATLQRIFPTLFKPIAKIPEPFIKHLSYPQDLFAMQMEIYSRFNQTKPDIFYQQSEALQLAKMDDKMVDPYYLTIDILDRPEFPETDTEKFILVSPLSPIGRDNLHSIAIAGCLKSTDCHKRYAEDIYVYQFPESVQVDGPAQISALIDQNPDISSQFTLWNQRGSKVIKGRMFIIPVRQSLLYIQPIYLAATTKTGFPQLTKVIVAMNQHAAIGDSIEAAYKKLELIEKTEYLEQNK